MNSAEIIIEQKKKELQERKMKWWECHKNNPQVYDKLNCTPLMQSEAVGKTTRIGQS